VGQSYKKKIILGKQSDLKTMNLRDFELCESDNHYYILYSTWKINFNKIVYNISLYKWQSHVIWKPSCLFYFE